MYGERGRLSPALGEDGNGTAGGRRGDGKMRSTEDTVLATCAEI